jgi:predicted NAD/FAD-dependent oxidoreductase
MTHAPDSRRRALLGAAAAWPWAGCSRVDAPRYTGGWVGAAHERGHRVRAAPGSTDAPPAHAARRCDVVVVGAGIAGLAAARALQRARIDDVQVFELEDGAGGNSRGHALGGIACPLGAHYLPLPGEHAIEVAQWLDEIGLRRSEHGRTVYDERHLCHSPQERLWIAGQWVDGLLPPADALPAAEREPTLRAYRRFHAAVQVAGRDRAFCLPSERAKPSASTAALDRLSFAAWLDAQDLRAPALRWYLDYCCRDDYGAGAAFVSAWAGLHYFASRHGFLAPGAGFDESDAVLTWPEGNAWLAARLAAPLGDRLHTGHVALRIREQRHHASVEFWNAATGGVQTWNARHVVLALPLFVAARLLDPLPAALADAAARLVYAPWLVANLQLAQALDDIGGAAPAWDNVRMGSATLGYVDAMHQSTRPHPGPTVLTAYWALGGDSPHELHAQRARLLGEPWTAWADAVLRDLAVAHPEIGTRVERIDLMRYGHAMAIPAPGVHLSGALQALRRTRSRVHFAHSDLSGYSVFEEAFFHGERAGRAAAAALRAVPAAPPRSTPAPRAK